jgi:preprotein translocase subunit SecE
MSEVKVKKANAMVEYFQESFVEMKKVTWPTRNQAVRLTLLVLGFCIGAAVIIGAVDALFSYGHQQLIDYAATVNPAPTVTDTTATTTPITDTTAIPVGNVDVTTAPVTSAADSVPATTPATATDTAPAASTPTAPVAVPQQ